MRCVTGERPESIERLVRVVVVVLDQNVLHDFNAVTVSVNVHAGVLGGSDVLIERMTQDKTVLLTFVVIAAQVDRSELPARTHLSVDDHDCSEITELLRILGDVHDHVLKSNVIDELHVRAVSSGHTLSIHLCAQVC